MRLTEGDGVVDFEDEDDVKHDVVFVVLLLFIHGGSIGEAETFGSGGGVEPDPSERMGEFRFGITTVGFM